MVADIAPLIFMKYLRVVFWAKMGKLGLVKGPVLPPTTPGATFPLELAL
jgi:hypothetical protein